MTEKKFKIYAFICFSLWTGRCRLWCLAGKCERQHLLALARSALARLWPGVLEIQVIINIFCCPFKFFYRYKKKQFCHRCLWHVFINTIEDDTMMQYVFIIVQNNAGDKTQRIFFFFFLVNCVIFFEFFR